MPKLQATKAQGGLESNPDVTHTSLSQQGEVNLVLLFQHHRAKGWSNARKLTCFSPRCERNV